LHRLWFSKLIWSVIDFTGHFFVLKLKL